VVVIAVHISCSRSPNRISVSVILLLLVVVVVVRELRPAVPQEGMEPIKIGNASTYSDPEADSAEEPASKISAAIDIPYFI